MSGRALAGDRGRRTIALVTHPYVPDPTSVGQHMAGAAAELAARGNRVVVFTANRGYADASVRYPAREVRDGVEIRRLPLSSFGKRSYAVRFLAGLSFTVQAMLRLLLMRRLDVVLVSTTPPVAPLAAIAAGVLRRARVVYWVMDLNPDQLVALGMAGPRSLIVRAFDAMNRAILRVSRAVVVLDRFMLERVAAKAPVRDKLVVLPPWPVDGPAGPVEHAANPFRRQHARPDQVVVMYSGNFSPTNPLTTVIEAARRLRDDPRFLFMFIGGGSGKGEVDEAGLRNAVSLPYQPLDQLRYSLSAADVHVVTMGDDAVGVVHPCKVYGAMAVGRPVLFVGPAPSHISDLVDRGRIGWAVRQGDVEGVLAALEAAAGDPAAARAAGRRGEAMVGESLGKAALCAALCDVIEGRGPAPSPDPALAAPRATHDEGVVSAR